MNILFQAAAVAVLAVCVLVACGEPETASGVAVAAESPAAHANRIPRSGVAMDALHPREGGDPVSPGGARPGADASVETPAEPHRAQLAGHGPGCVESEMSPSVETGPVAGNVPESLAESLHDADDARRAQGLADAIGRGVFPPADELERLALADPSEAVRFTALNAAASDPSGDRDRLLALAWSASQDTSDAVRTRALEILDRLNVPSGALP